MKHFIVKQKKFGDSQMKSRERDREWKKFRNPEPYYFPPHNH